MRKTKKAHRLKGSVSPPHPCCLPPSLTHPQGLPSGLCSSSSAGPRCSPRPAAAACIPAHIPCSFPPREDADVNRPRTHPGQTPLVSPLPVSPSGTRSGPCPSPGSPAPRTKSQPLKLAFKTLPGVDCVIHPPLCFILSASTTSTPSTFLTV